MPMPDPPPKNDPSWKRHEVRYRWFQIGCCGGLPIGLVGVVLLATCFPVRAADDDDLPPGTNRAT